MGFGPFGRSAEEFILTIGENGAVLTHAKSGTVKSRLFAATPAQADRNDIDRYLRRFPNIPIAILVDTSDQTYVQQSVPAVSSFNVGQLIKRRMKRDYPANDLKNYMPVGRAKTGRKDWIYLFAVCGYGPLVQEWVNYVVALPNVLDGIFLQPLETQRMLEALYRITIPGAKANAKIKNWQLWMSHNKVGGFRQVVTSNGRVIFARLITLDTNSSAGVLAGHVEQEIANTMEYMHRLGLEETSSLHSYIVVANEILEAIERTKIPGEQVFLFTPHELAKRLGVNNAALEDDHFTDVVQAGFFSKKSPVLRFMTPVTQKIAQIQMAEKVITMAGYLLVPLFLLLAGWRFSVAYQLQKEIAAQENEKISIDQRWKTAQSMGQYDIDEADKIVDITAMQSLLYSFKNSPVDLTQMMATALKEEGLVRSFEWNAKIAPTQANPVVEDGAVTSVFSIDFYNTGANIEELFYNFEVFTGRIKDTFKDYKVEHSKLPEKITFGNKDSVIAIQVTLTYPKPQQ